ncbi:MAG: class I SAM-dependent methyltransferase [Smithella sp.]
MLEKLTGQKLVCPWWLCFTFDNPLRRLLHTPEVILSPYVQPGNNVIDVGAGMGYFSIPLAKLVGPLGHVTAVDIQPQMLSVLSKRAKRSGVSERLTTYLATAESLGNHTAADFILAFWMVHEVPDQKKLLRQIHALLKPNGLFLFVEPVVHVPKHYFLQTLQTAQSVGFSITEYPHIRISHSALLSCNKDSNNYDSCS